MFLETVRSEKLQNESSPNFSNFRPGFSPEFSSEFSRNFSSIFRSSFRGKRRPEKIHQKSPPFFNAKFPGKHEKNIHKMFLESRQRKMFLETEVYPVHNWSLARLQGPSSRPQPQYWINFLYPWEQDFYPVLGCSCHHQKESTTPPSTCTG